MDEVARSLDHEHLGRRRDVGECVCRLRRGDRIGLHRIRTYDERRHSERQCGIEKRFDVAGEHRVKHRRIEAQHRFGHLLDSIGVKAVTECASRCRRCASKDAGERVDGDPRGLELGDRLAHQLEGREQRVPFECRFAAAAEPKRGIFHDGCPEQIGVTLCERGGCDAAEGVSNHDCRLSGDLFEYREGIADVAR